MQKRDALQWNVRVVDDGMYFTVQRAQLFAIAHKLAVYISGGDAISKNLHILSAFIPYINVLPTLDSAYHSAHGFFVLSLRLNQSKHTFLAFLL